MKNKICIIYRRISPNWLICNQRIAETTEPIHLRRWGNAGTYYYVPIYI